MSEPSEDLDFATYLGVIEERDLKSYRGSAVWEARFRQAQGRLDAYIAKYGELTDSDTTKGAAT